MIWFRNEFIDHPEQLATFGECARAAGVAGNKTIAKWRDYYDNFPAVVCAADTRPSAQKWLVRHEFAEWLQWHHQQRLTKAEAALKRRRQELKEAQERVAAEREQVRITESLREAWTKPA